MRRVAPFLLSLCLLGCPSDQEKEPVQSAPLFAPEVLGGYKLVIADDEGVEPWNRWCNLDLVNPEARRLDAKAWRADGQEFTCSDVRGRGKSVTLKIEREYERNETEVTETWFVAAQLETHRAKPPPEEVDDYEEGEMIETPCLLGTVRVESVTCKEDGPEDGTKRTRNYKLLALKGFGDEDEAIAEFDDAMDDAQKAKEADARAHAARLTEEARQKKLKDPDW